MDHEPGVSPLFGVSVTSCSVSEAILGVMPPLSTEAIPVTEEAENMSRATLTEGICHG